MIIKRSFFPLFHLLWRLCDRLVPKRPDCWAFATHHLHSDRFIENQRAVFEHVKGDPTIRKVIFYRGPTPDFSIEHAVNFETVEHGSARGLWLLARSQVVFLTHSITMDFSFRWPDRGFAILKLDLTRRVVVNLWHGIPLKRLLHAANDATMRHTHRIKYRSEERAHYAGLVASSDIDSYAMAAMFYPLCHRQVWVTGLPRNDFLLLAEARLPSYIRTSIGLIRQACRGRRLVVYAPTYRQTAISPGAYYYQFSPDEVSALKTMLREHNAVLGFRPHYFKNSEQFFNLGAHVDGETILDFSAAAIPEFSAIARECAMLVTDYSSVYMETTFLGKPAVSFAYDLDHYRQEQDGLLYDLSLAFPGPVCPQFKDVISAIGAALQEPERYEAQARTARTMFFKYRDAENSRRLCDRVKAQLD